LDPEGDDAVVVLLDGRLPAATPRRRAAWERAVLLDRAGAGVVESDAATTEEPEAGVVEVVRVELVNRVAVRARAHEAVQDPVVVPAGRPGTHGLVGVVATDHAAIRLRIVRLADL